MLGFIQTACTGFLGSYSLWMNTLLNQDLVGRTLDFSQSKLSYPLLGLEGGGVGECVEGMGGKRG